MREMNWNSSGVCTILNSFNTGNRRTSGCASCSSERESSWQRFLSARRDLWWFIIKGKRNLRKRYRSCSKWSSIGWMRSWMTTSTACVTSSTNGKCVCGSCYHTSICARAQSISTTESSFIQIWSVVMQIWRSRKIKGTQLLSQSTSHNQKVKKS